MNPNYTVIVNYNTSWHVKLFLIFLARRHPHEDKGLSWPVGANRSFHWMGVQVYHPGERERARSPCFRMKPWWLPRRKQTA